MKHSYLPLLRLFNKLREDYSLPLGIEEYTAVLRALQAGIGIENREKLECLCRTVWVKNEEDAPLFHRLFEEALANEYKEFSRQEVTKPTTEPDSSTGKTETQSDFLPDIPFCNIKPNESLQIAQAIRRKSRYDTNIQPRRYNYLPTDYLPVTHRQMKQSWRQMRRPVREGPLTELNVAATVEKIGMEGFLWNPVLMPRRINRAELVLMIDQDGSMAPFHSLSHQLVEIIRRGGRLKQAHIYYFHDYPSNYLYRDTARLEAEPVSEVLEQIDERSAVLIFSDAGAARGRLDEKRIKRTKELIEKIKQAVRFFAWLNPMPNNRWQHTSAGEIAQFVPMFEMNRRGLDDTISALRGQYVYWEKLYPWMI